MEVERPEPNTRSKPVEVDPVTVRQRAEKRNMDAKARSKRNRDRRKAEKMANGTARGPGRPLKSDRSIEVIAADYLEFSCGETQPTEGSDSTDISLHELIEPQPSHCPRDQNGTALPWQSSST